MSNPLADSLQADMNSIDAHGNAEYPDVPCDSSSYCRWDWVQDPLLGQFDRGGHYELTDVDCGGGFGGPGGPVGPRVGRCYCAQMDCDDRLLRYGFRDANSTNPYDNPYNHDCFARWMNPNRRPGGALVIKRVDTATVTNAPGTDAAETYKVITSITFACSDSKANQQPAPQPTPGIMGACCQNDGACLVSTQAACSGVWYILHTCSTVNNGNGCTPSAPQPIPVPGTGDPSAPFPSPPVFPAPGDPAEPPPECTGGCTWEWAWAVSGSPSGSAGEYKVTSDPCGDTPGGVASDFPGHGICGCIWPEAVGSQNVYHVPWPTSDGPYVDYDIGEGVLVSGADGSIRMVKAPCTIGGSEPPPDAPDASIPDIDQCNQQECTYKWHGPLDPISGTPATFNTLGTHPDGSQRWGQMHRYARPGGTYYHCFVGLDQSQLRASDRQYLGCCGNACTPPCNGCMMNIATWPKDTGSGNYGHGNGYARTQGCQGDGDCECDKTNPLYEMAQRNADGSLINPQRYLGGGFSGSPIDGTGTPKSYGDDGRIEKVNCVTSDTENLGSGYLGASIGAVVDGGSSRAHGAGAGYRGKKPIDDDIVSVEIPTGASSEDVNTDSGYQVCMGSAQDDINAVQQVANQMAAGCFDCPPKVGQRLAEGVTVAGVKIGDSDDAGETYSEGDCVLLSSSDFRFAKSGTSYFDKKKYAVTALTEAANFRAMKNDQVKILSTGRGYPESKYPAHDSEGHAIENSLDTRQAFRSKGSYLAGYAVDNIEVKSDPSNENKYDIVINYRNRNDEPSRDPVVQQAAWNGALAELNDGGGGFGLIDPGDARPPTITEHGEKTDQYTCNKLGCLYKFIDITESYELQSGCGRGDCECDPENEVVQWVKNGVTARFMGELADAACVSSKKSSVVQVEGGGGPVGSEGWHHFGNEPIKKPGPDGWPIAAGSSPTSSTTWKPPAFKDVIPIGAPPKANDADDTHLTSENTTFYKPSASGQIVIDANGNVTRTSESSYKGRIAHGKMGISAKSFSIGAEALLAQHFFANQHEAEADALTLGLSGSHSRVIEDKTLWLPGSRKDFIQWFRDATPNRGSFGSATTGSTPTGTTSTTSGSGGTGGSTGTSSTGSSSSSSGY